MQQRERHTIPLDTISLWKPLPSWIWTCIQVKLCTHSSLARKQSQSDPPRKSHICLTLFQRGWTVGRVFLWLTMDRRRGIKTRRSINSLYLYLSMKFSSVDDYDHDYWLSAIRYHGDWVTSWVPVPYWIIWIQCHWHWKSTTPPALVRIPYSSPLLQALLFWLKKWAGSLLWLSITSSVRGVVIFDFDVFFDFDVLPFVFDFWRVIYLC